MVLTDIKSVLPLNIYPAEALILQRRNFSSVSSSINTNNVGALSTGNKAHAGDDDDISRHPQKSLSCA
jgi:hypothetical protein